MCGIYGTTRIYKTGILEKKLDAMRHRGPDYSDIQHVAEEVIFGQVRLSILDLNARSNQPFKYQHIWITFNGEIYNYVKLKGELKNLGYKFTTTSDTEVLCALYLEYGINMVTKLNGMYAFAIYDNKKDIIFGARDKMGQKPFYYSLENNVFEFGSHLSSVAIGNDFKINREAIKQFLEWGYVPEPMTMFNNVYKLKASHLFVYDLNSKEINTQPYEIEDREETIPELYNDGVSVLDEMLNHAVSDRLVSDVPLGVFLSGGVDSSLIAAIAQKNSGTKLQTFSVGFNEATFDESEYAQKVAKHIGTDHHRIMLGVDEGLKLLEGFEYYFDEPFFDTSSFGQMLLARETKKYVTVALSGDGGDELFLGYNRYLAFQNRAYLFDMPGFVRSSFALGLKSFTGNHRLNNIYNVFKTPNIESYYLESMTNRNRKWLNFEPAKNIEYQELLYSGKNLLERISDFEIKTYMNGDILTKVDRSTMKYSLEARSPFMDARVVNFSRKIPTDFKYRSGIGKSILKDVLYRYVPKELFERKKSGFGVPLSEWFRNELKDWVYEVLSDKNLDLIPEINKKEFMIIVESHMRGEFDFSLKIWSVVSLINWLKLEARNFNKN